MENVSEQNMNHSPVCGFLERASTNKNFYLLMHAKRVFRQLFINYEAHLYLVVYKVVVLSTRSNKYDILTFDPVTYIPLKQLQSPFFLVKFSL